MRYPAQPRWIGWGNGEAAEHGLTVVQWAYTAARDGPDDVPGLPERGRVTFSPRDRATILAFAEVLLPGGGGLPSARDVDVAGTMERYIRNMDPRQAGRLTWLIRGFSALPAVSGRFRRFRHLQPSGRERFLRRLASGGGYRRQAYAALKQFVVTAWASSPEVSAAMGFDGSCLADDPDHAGFVRGYLPQRAP